MRHGIAFRKLSRTSSHRDLMLRNMVSSLLEHERITTTVAKAKEASRIAEWVISWGKRGTAAQKRRAEAFLMNKHITLPKLFDELSQRYASRSGGYTRVHHFGNRRGDHAPQAILELVDNPNDLRFHMTARIVGRELARLTRTNPSQEAKVLEWATSGTPLTKSQPEVYGLLNDMTRLHTKKALRFLPSSSSSSSSSTTADAESSSSSTPSTPSGSNNRLSLQQFDSLAKEAFFRTTAISKVPLWDEDLNKYEDLLLQGKENPDSVPVTTPGQGRKLWAGQEDFGKRYSASTPTISQKSTREESAWEDIDEEQVQTEQQKKEIRDKWTKKKVRHADGRNGALGQRSAIARSKGHQAPPRSMSERKLRLDMPVSSI